MTDRVVVVVAYGHAELLEVTLGALARDEVVLVVDNSSDAGVAAVAGRHGARYLDAGHNRGFAGGVNLALEDLQAHAVPGDVLLLNPDARISSDQIDVLHDVLAAPGNEDVAAVAPNLTGPDGNGQRVYWPFPTPGGMWREATGLQRLAHSPQAGGFVVGAVLLLRRSALDQLGGFDERYFLYAEEADWQRRARLHGWRSMLVPHVRAHHVGAGTSHDEDERTRRFHAAQETYVRRWHGPTGWLAYRAAAWFGGIARGLVLGQASARGRARLYARGPRRAAPLPPVGCPLHIAHVVVTDSLAGTERHVAALASAQAAGGHEVVVIGGDPLAMPALCAPARWLPGATLRSALRAVRGCPDLDVVHSHLTAADLVGAASGPWHGARLISTRHIAARRGSSRAARLAVALLQRRIDAEICISEFVRDATGRSAVVVPNGVASSDESPLLGSRQVVLAQRLEAEKATDVALAAWKLSGLAAEGWTLAVAGDGALRASLEAAAPECVRWLGWVDDARALLLDSAVLLAPARGEPFGLSVLEAMSIGLPVVAAAGGAHLETVGAVDGALLFAPGDAAACADVLRRVAALDPGTRSALGERLRAHQQQRFTLASQVAATEVVYRSS